jgi:hypothetical protein
MKTFRYILPGALAATVLLVGCNRPQPVPASTPAPVKTLSPHERLIGHWITEDHRPDGSPQFVNNYFFRPDSYTNTFRISEGGQVFRFDVPYRIMETGDNRLIIQTAMEIRPGLQSRTEMEYIFASDDTVTSRSYDDKKRVWSAEAVMHRVDDRQEP